ncbi:DUF1861 family protein [Companilactobacillus huachuanensis]|uniref:DUF1861 family protein n=1 Tax=Companilactobacillus huachuanensis TaxID=2559914 RepID=A0ABW1RQI2_9LACO|nr:DUF1861 family protein [Companilactobacillus huachuanensis]
MKEIKELLSNHRNNNSGKSMKIEFKGVDGFDVYNTSICFELNHETMIAGRVEKRNSEKSETRIFKKVDENKFELLPEFSLSLQDPFITVINKDEIVLGGVQVDWTVPEKPVWRTEFYRLYDDLHAELLFRGPLKMKDIRLLELNNNRILMLTRPQGGEASFGKIGILIRSKISEFEEEEIENAPLLKNNFEEGTWGGANQITQVSDNVVKVIGHIAEKINNKLHYYSISFFVDLMAQKIFNEHIIAERKDFLAGPTKRDDLADVVFTSGINEDSTGKQWLLCGTSDCEEQCIEVIE